jgi:3-dehydroquinate synthase
MLPGMRKVRVALGERSYDILVGQGLLAGLGVACRKVGLRGRCVVVTDSNVGPLHGEAAMASLRGAGFEPVLVTVPAGERAKSVRQAGLCYDRLAAERLERRSFVVALGGGVVGDLAGFVAATYLRGLALVQVPTTLLAQVDSSVGGKTGVNLAAGKNLVGAFWQPKLVLCDLDTLKTLPAREFRAGLGEVIKYGVIWDAALFRRLERGMDLLLAQDPAELGRVVARCCAIKAEVVGEDETESGLRAILNFGHTFGHGLEATTRYGKFLHGEAISIGMLVAARLSQELLGFSAGDVERLECLLERAGLPVRVGLNRKQREVLTAAMRVDKKVTGGELRFVLAESMGKVRFGERVSVEQVWGAFGGLTGEEVA